jgi:hypothetical protein
MYSPFVVSHPHYSIRKFPPDRQFGPILFHLQKKSIFPVKISRLPRLGLGKDPRGTDRGGWEFVGRRATFPCPPGKKGGAKIKKGREKSPLSPAPGLRKETPWSRDCGAETAEARVWEKWTAAFFGEANAFLPGQGAP